MRCSKHLAARLAALIVMLLGLPANSTAIEKLDAGELLSACKVADKYAVQSESPCAMYVQGFFAGMKIYGNKPASELSFQERALKTRTGHPASTDTAFAKSKYCLPEDTSLATFIGQIQAVDQSRFKTKTADQLIRSILHQYYQCRQ